MLVLTVILNFSDHLRPSWVKSLQQCLCIFSIICRAEIKYLVLLLVQVLKYVS